MFHVSNRTRSVVYPWRMGGAAFRTEPIIADQKRPGHSVECSHSVDLVSLVVALSEISPRTIPTNPYSLFEIALQPTNRLESMPVMHWRR
jgi:hypothetical protein